ncbi:amino acid ABC transporter ATP-binding/permease protein [Isobaculum melis]|uniref:ATP-binding cassette, subfamily C n=1 Tax=Isobaculum melis TaxID=142588 RepID=A0A1H9TT16_9LACT|nr:ABC transporter ATP-binding protein [Isobaculum melis]SES00236.1 ATP-binding cassette, subfamily C [Isobaculum melis]
MNKWRLLTWLLGFVKPLKGKMVVAILLGIVSNLAIVAIPVIGFQQVILYLNGGTIQVGPVIFLLVGLGILRGIARYGEQYCNHDIAFRLLALLRQKMFHQLRLLGPAKLAGVKSGDFITTITSDVEALEVFFAHSVSPFFIFLGTTLATVGFLATQAWQLALVLVLALLIVGLLIPLMSYRRYEQVAAVHQQQFVALNQQAMESITSLSNIEQFHLGEAKLQEMHQTGEALNRSYGQKLRQGTQLLVSNEMLLTLTALLIFLIGSLFQVNGELIGLGVILSLSAFGPAFALSGLGNALLTTFASGERIYQLFQEEPQVLFPTQSEKEVSTLEQVTFEQVDFTYPDSDKTILSNIDLLIPQGKTIGISGPSGIGKSTLIKLCMRYWDPKSGKIMLNQKELKRFSEESIHRLEGFFEQTTFLFEDTVENNIRIGKEKASMEEIQQAAKKVAIHPWIESLPEGYQSKIGGLERQVSDGERQRIGLARLFLQNAPLLLLDEPTSNLDFLNELAILESFKVLQDKAILVVSHRETTLSIADESFELVEGKLNKI